MSASLPEGQGDRAADLGVRLDARTATRSVGSDSPVVDLGQRLDGRDAGSGTTGSRPAARGRVASTRGVPSQAIVLAGGLPLGRLRAPPLAVPRGRLAMRPRPGYSIALTRSSIGRLVDSANRASGRRPRRRRPAPSPAGCRRGPWDRASRAPRPAAVQSPIRRSAWRAEKARNASVSATSGSRARERRRRRRSAPARSSPGAGRGSRSLSRSTSGVDGDRHGALAQGPGGLGAHVGGAAI